MKNLFKISFLFLINYILTSNASSLEATNKEAIQKTYQLMKDVNDVFSFYKIDYWIQGSTLFGAVRFNGLIPWLDNLDICMQNSQNSKLLLTLPTLALLGYKAIKMVYGYRVFPNDGFEIDDNEKLWKYPYCDIWLMIKNEDKIYHNVFLKNGPKRKSGRAFIKENELFPLTKYIFGPLVLSGPNNPYMYLQLWYGPNWYTSAMKSMNPPIINNLHKKLSEKVKTKAALPENALIERFIIPSI